MNRRREVEEYLAQNGLSIRVHLAKPGQALTEFPEPRVNAILVPAEAELWNLEKKCDGGYDG